jgi:hypothetical protein
MTASEVGTAALREKTMALGTAVNTIVGWVVIFTTVGCVLLKFDRDNELNLVCFSLSLTFSLRLMLISVQRSRGFGVLSA